MAPAVRLRPALPPLFGRFALIVLLIAGLFLPFWLAAGSPTLGFLAYHRDRGLEIESTYSSALMCLRPFGLALGIEFKYGSFNLLSSLSPAVTWASGLIAAVLVAAASLGLAWAVVRRPCGEGPERGATWRKTYPLPFILFSLLLLLLLVAANKVFSPQYLLWLAPLAALVPSRPGPRRIVAWGFVGICALTTLIYPVLFWKDVLGLVVPETDPPNFQGPTALGITAVVVRNVFFLGLTTYLAVVAHSHASRLFTVGPGGLQADETRNAPARPPRKRFAPAFASLSIFGLLLSVNKWLA